MIVNGHATLDVGTEFQTLEYLFTKEGKPRYNGTCNFKHITAWREGGSFHFDSANFTFVMQSIDRWYKTKTYNIEFLPDYKVSINLLYKLPIDSALAAIERVVPVKFERSADAILVNH